MISPKSEKLNSTQEDEDFNKEKYREMHTNEAEFIEDDVEKLSLRQRLIEFMDSRVFHHIIIGLVMLDLVIILSELLITLYAAEGIIAKSTALHTAELSLTVTSLIILSLFVLEIVTKLALIGPKYLANAWHILDTLVVLSSFVLEIYFISATNSFAPANYDDPIAKEIHHKAVSLVRRSDHAAKQGVAPLIIIRLWKFIRIIHAVAHSVEMKNKAIIDKIKKQHNDAEEKIQRYNDIITNLSHQMEQNDKKIAELEHLVKYCGEYH